MGREEIISGDDGENIVGALQALQRASSGWQARPGAGRTVSRPAFSQTNVASQAGGTRDNKLRAPLGLGSHVFTDNSPFRYIVEPQEAFRGERLIVETAADEGLILSIDLIMVGSLPQMPSTEFGLGAGMFRADATDAQMDWQICPAGTKIMVEAHVVGTFGEGDELTAVLGIYGAWIRG